MPGGRAIFPKSGHSSARVACPLSANSGHRGPLHCGADSCSTLVSSIEIIREFQNLWLRQGSARATGRAVSKKWPSLETFQAPRYLRLDLRCHIRSHLSG